LREENINIFHEIYHPVVNYEKMNIATLSGNVNNLSNNSDNIIQTMKFPEKESYDSRLAPQLDIVSIIK